MTKYRIYTATHDGTATAEITGDEAMLDLIESALQRAGFEFDQQASEHVAPDPAANPAHPSGLSPEQLEAWADDGKVHDGFRVFRIPPGADFLTISQGMATGGGGPGTVYHNAGAGGGACGGPAVMNPQPTPGTGAGGGSKDGR